MFCRNAKQALSLGPSHQHEATVFAHGSVVCLPSVLASLHDWHWK
jgi:hypothetical protein